MQTRFVERDGQTQLLVRIYPDEFHVDGHEERLTAAEAEWGRRYWELIWPLAGEQDAERGAWEQLVGRFGARRAAWVARRMTPRNIGQRPQPNQPGVAPAFPDPGSLKDDAFTQPAVARLLPDRWVVIGYQGADRALLEVGAPISAALSVSLTPDESTLPAPADDELPIDPGMRWMIDFTEAERVGMGIRIVLPPEQVGRSFNRLLVFGVTAALAPQAAAERLEAQIDAQHYTRGLGFIQPGTPTNNTAEVSAGISHRDPNGAISFASEVHPPPLTPTSDGSITAQMLGIRRVAFATLEGASRQHDLDARHMLTALWPVTGGYYLEQKFCAKPADQPATATPQELDQARRYCIDLAARGRPIAGLTRLGISHTGCYPSSRSICW